jgi:hypothetical protein
VIVKGGEREDIDYDECRVARMARCCPAAVATPFVSAVEQLYAVVIVVVMRV